MTIARLAGVEKRYGLVVAVAGVSLEIARGECVTLLGANGAGKTTTLEMLLGLRRPDAGTVRLFGGSPADPQIRSRVGVTPQQTGVPAPLRVGEIVDFVRAHYANPAPRAELLEAFGLTAFAHRQTGGLSGGEMRRLGLALAFAGNPELAVLDEPTTGLDIEARRSVWQYVRAYVAAGGTVLLTTHHMEEAEALSSRIAVLRAGSIVADGTPATIRRSVALRRLTYVGDPFDPAAFGLEAAVEFSGGRVVAAAADTDALLRAVVKSGMQFSDLTITDASLEDAVLSLTGDSK